MGWIILQNRWKALAFWISAWHLTSRLWMGRTSQTWSLWYILTRGSPLSFPNGTWFPPNPTINCKLLWNNTRPLPYMNFSYFMTDLVCPFWDHVIYPNTPLLFLDTVRLACVWSELRIVKTHNNQGLNMHETQPLWHRCPLQCESLKSFKAQIFMLIGMISFLWNFHYSIIIPSPSFEAFSGYSE